MRISIWQQFSSNHSADFRIVSVFKTPEDAQKAAEELKRVLKKLADWHSDPTNQPLLSEIGDSFARDQDNRLHIPPEIELDDQYGIGFSYEPLDWLWDVSQVVETIAIYQSIVYFSNDPHMRRTWSGEEPFDRLLEKLGGETYVAGGRTEDEFWLQVTTVAPDESTAKRIVSEIKNNMLKPSLSQPSIPILAWEWDDDLVVQENAHLTFLIQSSEVRPGLPDLLAYLEKNTCKNTAFNPIKLRD